MKTPKYQLTVRAVAAAAIALAGSFYAVPALAEDGPAGSATVSPTPSESASQAATTPEPAPATPVSPTASAATPPSAISDAGLAEAIRRDLGMTLEQFNAAGAQARRAADAAPSLRALPGYIGIVLRDGKIVVQGSGARLQARINELNQAGPDEFTLEAVPGGTSPAREASPAAASAAPELVAGSAEQLFQAYVREVGPAGLQAVAYADGHFIIRTGGTNTPEAKAPAAPMPGSRDAVAEPVPGKISAADFVSRYANVALEKGAAIKTEEDFFGGQGVVIDNMTICSAGFGAFDPAGLPLVLTAGHCAEDGTATRADVEPATAATAGGATTPLPAVRKALGTFGFSQFGGPHNSPITGSEGNPGNIGTDIAVIKDLRPGLTIQPSVTKWRGDGPTFTNADPANPGPTAVKIIGTAAPYQGQAVCRSGRTEGWSCGTVAETGIYVVGGRTGAPGDLRAFKGFLSYDVQSSGGDSGGPWISGNFAVGTHSAGEPQGAQQNFAVATTLDDALNHIPGGVQLQLFLNKPELVTPANSGAVAAGELIRGHVPAAPASEVAPHSKVRITVGAQKLDVPVDAAGNWAFRAPIPSGKLAFSAETVNGFSHSGPASFTATVAPAPLPAPGITTPTGAALPVGAPAQRPAAQQPAAQQPAGQGQPAVQQPGVPSQQSPAQQPGGHAQPAGPAQVPVPPSDASVTVRGAAPESTPSGRTDPLASMGASGLLPAAGLGAGALLLGAAFVAFGRRRRAR